MEKSKNQQVRIPSPTDKKCKNCIHWRTSIYEGEWQRTGRCTLTGDIRHYWVGTECENFTTGK